MVIIQIIVTRLYKHLEKSFSDNNFFQRGLQFFCLNNIIKYLWFVKQKNYNIFTDEASEFQGGIGTVGSANIGKRYAISYSMGKNILTANFTNSFSADLLLKRSSEGRFF